MSTAIRTAIPKWPRWCAQAAGGLVFLIGITVLTGWTLGLPAIESFLSGRAKMPAQAALGFVLAGLGLWCVAADSAHVNRSGPKCRRLFRRMAQICAGAVLLLALLKLGEHLLGWELGIDRVFKKNSEPFPLPQMALATVISFLLCGCALLLATASGPMGLFQFFTLLGGLIGWLGLSRFLYGGGPLLGFGQMVFPSAVAFLILNAGLLCTRTEGGLMGLILSPSAGGVIMRRLLPAALCVPFVIGCLRLYGQRLGWYGTEAGTSLFALTNVLLFGVGVWMTAGVLHRSDTERKQAARQLRRSEAQLRLIWENALDGMRLTDQDGSILMVNEAYCRLVEKPRESLEGRPLSVVYEPDRAEEITRKHYERFQTRSVGQHYEREISFWNRKKVFLELSNSFLELEGQPTVLVTTARDITGRKRSEQREAAFANLSRSLSAAASADEAAHLIADSADELIGWDAYSLDLYLAEENLICPVMNIDLVDGKRRAVTAAYAGQPPSAIARQILDQGARIILRPQPCDFSTEGVPFGDRNRPSASLMYVLVRLGQRPIGILSIQSYRPQAYSQQDLDTLQTLADQCAGALERVRSREALRELNEQLELRVAHRTAELEAAIKELEAFSYSVSHDLRAPLRGIVGYSQILLEDYGSELDAEAKRLFGVIQGETQRMGKLIDALLNFSRLGRQDIQLSTLNMTALAESVSEQLLASAPEPKPELQLQPLPPTHGDQALMRQVFINLLSNAIKFSRGKAMAKIQIGCLGNSGQNIYYVKDNGAGFDSRYSNKLFGVFERLHRADEFEGTGVGLALVQRIIHRHGGKIWAEGKVNGGAAFYFTILEQKGRQTKSETI